MTIRTSKQAMAAALGQTTNVPGTCQLTVRGWFDAPSAGDQDGDGDADAVDGWLSEPRSARHEGDRNPPPGKPLAFKGGSRGFGHRALSMVKGVRSTDMSGNRYKVGVTSTVTGTSTASAIAQIERSMGVQYLGWSETIDGQKIPADPSEVKPPRPKTLKRKFAHASLEFSDNDKMTTADIEKIFSQDFDIITGTEAGRGAGNTADELHRVAEKHGYFLAYANGYDTWAAVKISNAVPGTFRQGVKHVIDRSAAWSPKPDSIWGNRGIVFVRFEDKDLGVMSIGAIHALTLKANGPAVKKKTDEMYSRAIAAWGQLNGKGLKLAFIAGDFNRSDRVNDLFIGAPFTTCWDEMRIWPNTGHGNIDAIASYDDDDRTKCVLARAHDDVDFFLNTDHYLVTATYEIQVLPN